MVKHPVKSTLPLLHRIAQVSLRIDDRLRRWNRVFEYSKDPHCMFRMQIGIARQDVSLSDGTLLRCGDRLIDLHLWNEHIPEVPPEGPTIRWARQWAHGMYASLHQVSDFLGEHPELEDVEVIRAHTVLATARMEPQLVRIMGHFGFQTIRDDRPVSWAERFHRAGENVLGLLFVLAVNPRRARISVLSRTRSDFLISRKALRQRCQA